MSLRLKVKKTSRNYIKIPSVNLTELSVSFETKRMSTVVDFRQNKKIRFDSMNVKRDTYKPILSRSLNPSRICVLKPEGMNKVLNCLVGVK